MKLAVFDLDGTLARTNTVDEECFVHAFAEAVSIRNLSMDWMAYEHATDSAITLQVFRDKFGREPRPAETAKISECFVELLRARHAGNAADFVEVPGASAFISDLRGGREWAVALATGGWRRSAQFKIRCAGVPVEDVPAAFAEDGPSRESIVQKAIERACMVHGVREFERIVSVGDALWDVRTARNLRLAFVGVSSGTDAGLLKENGVVHVLDNFLNRAECFQYLEHSIVPA